MSNFRRLSRDELKTLSGARQRDKVVQWLRKAGWIFEVDARGWPIVSSSYAEARLSGQKPDIGGDGIDFGALERAA